MDRRKILILAKRRYWYTNKIRNPRGEGGTVGVIGSGGALPTNWALEQNMSGVTTSFIGAGVAANGLPYVDLGLAGTLSGANALIIRVEGATYATASAGQAWGLDFWSNIQAGTASGLASVKARIRDSAAAVVGESTQNGLTGSATLLRAKGVVAGSATSIYPRIVVDSLNNGAVVDATIRIYAPKLVQLAVIEGPELVTNGDFASGTGWTVSGGWAIADGKLNSVPATFDYADQVGITLTVGAVYKLIADVVRNAGSAIPYLYGVQVSPSLSASGTQTRYGVAGGSTGLGLRFGQNTFDGSLDNVSLKLVAPGYMPASPILPPVGTMGDSSARL